jgi:hypothetical protein
VQEEDFADLDAESVKLAAELLEGERAKAAGDQATKVLAAQVDLDRAKGFEGEGQKAERSLMMADGTALGLAALDERLAFTQGKAFQAVGTEWLVGNAVPVTLILVAAAAGEGREHAVGGGQTHAVHLALLRRRHAARARKGGPFPFIG